MHAEPTRTIADECVSLEHGGSVSEVQAAGQSATGETDGNATQGYHEHFGRQRGLGVRRGLWVPDGRPSEPHSPQGKRAGARRRLRY